jgi:hypothetical protein
MAVSKLEIRIAVLEAELQKRVTLLETEVARLKRKLPSASGLETPWWEKIWGTFANDPAHEEAMALGRKYRESLRPKPKSRRSRKSVKSKKS